MYKLEDNRLRSAKTSDWLNGTPSNSPGYLEQELPVEDRQALGWYTHVDYSTELTEATVDPVNDVIHMPAPKLDPFEISHVLKSNEPLRKRDYGHKSRRTLRAMRIPVTTFG